MTKSLVKVSFVDPTSGLKDDKSLVHVTEEFTSSKPDDAIKMQVVSDGVVLKKLEAHNAIRVETINEAALENHGTEVKLRPIELSDLSVTVHRS